MAGVLRSTASISDDVRTWDVDELRSSRRSVPSAPGVYTFLDESERALYVGKSVDLRSRLSSYFVDSPARRKTARMLAAAVRVRAERTGSEFAALLHEADLVQALRPPFNRQMATPERYVYLRVDYRTEFPSLSMTDSPDDEQARFLGPYVQRRQLAQVVEGLNDAFRLRTCEPIPLGEPCWRMQMRRCSAPCVAAVDAGAYGRGFLLVREALSGRTRSALGRLRDDRDRHAAAERFEAARAVQNRIDAIERLRRVLYASQAPAADALVVQPALAPGAFEMWGVARGAVRGSGVADRRGLRRLFERLWSSMSTRRAEEPIAKYELDRRCIVHRWVRSNRAAESCVMMGGLDREDAWEAVVDRAERQSGVLL